VQSIALPKTVAALLRADPEKKARKAAAMSHLQARKGVNRDTEALSDSLDSVRGRVRVVQAAVSMGAPSDLCTRSLGCLVRTSA